MRRARTDRLRRLGLSVAKIKTIKFVATEIALGRLDLPSLANLEAEEAHSVLTALHGIGAWTAAIYLLFCLGHSDAWPAGDLGIQGAVRIGLELEAKPTAAQMKVLAESWRIECSERLVE